MPVVYERRADVSFDNLLIVGSNSPPGGVRAFDARTGDGKSGLSTRVPRPASSARDMGTALRRERERLDWSFSFTVDVDRALLYVSFAVPLEDQLRR